MDETRLTIRQMKRDELDILVEWVAREGWNPGLSDADIFWSTDSEAFIAAEHNGELIGGGSIVSYERRYGFMGFFIIHPDHRGQGWGNQLWHERLRLLIQRLDTPVSIGMDGVFDMQPWYAKGGFNFAERDLRFEGTASSFAVPAEVIPLDQVSFETLENYDRLHFPAKRSGFLRGWTKQPGSFAYGFVYDGNMKGYGVIRPCRTGHKIGPLFANSPEIADDLFRSLVSEVPGEQVFLDAPESNLSAMDLAARYQMKEVFGCAKMYYGETPDLPTKNIYGVTSFEFG